STVLLLTRDECLFTEVRNRSCALPNLRLEVCTEADAARAGLRRDDTALMLLHLTAHTDTAVFGLLAEAGEANQAAAALVLGEPECAPRGVAVMQAGALDFLRLPTELCRLASLLDALTRRLPSEECAKGTLAASRRQSAGVNPFFRTVAPEMVEL